MVWSWALSPAFYVYENVRNVEKHLEEIMGKRWNLQPKTEYLFAYGYEPDLEETPILEIVLASYYQSQIGVLRWMVEHTGFHIGISVGIP